MISFVSKVVLLILLLRDCDATVDPFNATAIHIHGLQFNITHDYWRTRFLHDDRTLVSFWVNPYELPESMLLYENNRWHHITKTETMHRLIVQTTKRAFNDWNIGHRRLRFANYYHELARENEYLNRRPLYPIHKRLTASLGYPLIVHFRYGPYPQSSFGEFVSNRAIPWRVWNNDDDYQVSDYVGAKDDLLYRMRHNIGHSMGLGHTFSDRCIMYPTNVRYLVKLCNDELEAMRALLITPRIVDDGY